MGAGVVKLSISRQAEREYMVSSSIYHGIHYKESQEQCQWELLNEFGKKTARKVTSQCKITGCWVLVVFIKSAFPGTAYDGLFS